MTLELVAENKSFSGWHRQYQHMSSSTHCLMKFAVFLPPQAETGKVPVLYWLSGLTCTDENSMQKAGAQKLAAQLGIAIVAPDTSPRGRDGLDADGEPIANDESYDLGQGAGFYVNATQSPWAKHFNMYDYVVSELPDLIEQNFSVSSQRAITGHSMGGHGALTIALKNTNRYSSVSAFSPICHPVNCPWGEKAFTAYLGSDKKLWEEYDACELISKLNNKEQQMPMMIDQGMSDNFLAEQLKPETLEHAAQQAQYEMLLRRHEGYDHSYYFISSFIGDHLRFHAKYFSWET